MKKRTLVSIAALIALFALLASGAVAQPSLPPEWVAAHCCQSATGDCDLANEGSITNIWPPGAAQEFEEKGEYIDIPWYQPVGCANADCSEVVYLVSCVDTSTGVEFFAEITIHPYESPFSITPTPTSTMAPTPTPRPTITPTTPEPPPEECPEDVILYTEPEATLSYFPPHPVVVGQDPNKLGVTFYFTGKSYRVTHKWWEWECVAWSEPHCNCPEDAPYDSHEGWCTDAEWAAGCRNDDPDCTDHACVEHSETFDDPIDFTTLEVTAKMTDESKSWFYSYLAPRYPGAELRHPDWDVLDEAIDQGGLSWSDAGHYLEGRALNLQFEDPGEYKVVIDFWTSGTPYTWPFHCHEELILRVTVFGVTLIE